MGCMMLLHWINCMAKQLLPPANEVWGKVIFSVARVKNSVCRGEYLGRYPPGRYTPGRYTSLGRYTPQSRYPLGRYTPPEQVNPLGRYTPRQAGTPRADTPPRAGTPWAGTLEIWSMSGRYASYWNAFLLFKEWSKNCLWRNPYDELN